MDPEQANAPQPPKTFAGVLKSIWSLSASNADVFAVFVLVSFLVLVILAFLGRSAEMAVLAGFSAVCMAFLKLDKFSEFSGIGFSAKLREVEKKVEAIEVKETEVDPLPDASAQFCDVNVLQVSPQEKQALEAIENSKFTFRTATGIAQNLKTSQASARNLMVALEDKGLVSQIVTSRRTVAWNITAQGREYLAITRT